MLKRDRPKRREGGSLHDRIAELEEQLSLAQATIENLSGQKYERRSEAGRNGEEGGNAYGHAPRDAASRAAWYERFPGRNPNPVLRVGADGTVIYRNPAAADMPGWSAAVDTPVSALLLPLVSTSLEQGAAIERELEMGDHSYWVYVVPFTASGYANIYGRNITARRRAEEEVKTSEDELSRLNDALEERNASLEVERGRWQGVVEGIADEVWICDAEGRMSLMNLRATTAVGLDEFRDKPVDEVLDEVDIFHPDGTPRPAEYSPLLRALKGEIVRGSEIMRHRKTGRVRYRRFSAAPTRNGRGEITGAVAIAHDITDLKIIEQELADSRSRTQDLLNSLGDGLLALDREWNVIYVNPTAAKISERAEADLVGKSFWELWPGLHGTPLAAAFQHAMEDRMPGRVLAQGAASERWYDVNVYPSSEGITVYYVDKTEQIEAEEMREALIQQNRQQGELLDAILQVEPGGIAVFTNRDRRFQFVNPAYRAMLPIPGTDPVGKTIEEVWPSALGFKVEQTYMGPSQGSGPVTLERVTRKFPDGAVRHFKLHVDPLTWHGEPATLVVAWEITQLEEAKARAEEYAQKLQRSNDELEDFAFMASHDLQEPLRKIETFGDLVNQRATGLDSRSREYVDRMRDAAERMRSMVEALLQLSRVTMQGRPFERVRLSEVAAEVLSDLNVQIQQSGASVEVEPLPEVDGDPLQLHELIQNLVSNGLKYHAPGRVPQVKLTGRRARGSVELRVSDQGIGFEQEHAERIFQPFQRLVGRSEYAGSGIGLAICRRIVERHHGAIRAISKPGEGATFIVTLPEHQPVGTDEHSAEDASNA